MVLAPNIATANKLLKLEYLKSKPSRSTFQVGNHPPLSKSKEPRDNAPKPSTPEFPGVYQLGILNELEGNEEYRKYGAGHPVAIPPCQPRKVYLVNRDKPKSLSPHNS